MAWVISASAPIKSTLCASSVSRRDGQAQYHGQLCATHSNQPQEPPICLFRFGLLPHFVCCCTGMTWQGLGETSHLEAIETLRAHLINSYATSSSAVFLNTFVFKEYATETAVDRTGLPLQSAAPARAGTHCAGRVAPGNFTPRRSQIPDVVGDSGVFGGLRRPLDARFFERSDRLPTPATSNDLRQVQRRAIDDRPAGRRPIRSTATSNILNTGRRL
jgi:hypothetical protein